MTDNGQGGARVANSRASAAAAGPLVKYDSGKGWFATLKWQKEFAARNRAEGTPSG